MFAWSLVNYMISKISVWSLTAGKVKTRYHDKYFKAKNIWDWYLGFYLLRNAKAILPYTIFFLMHAHIMNAITLVMFLLVWIIPFPPMLIWVYCGVCIVSFIVNGIIFRISYKHDDPEAYYRKQVQHGQGGGFLPRKVLTKADIKRLKNYHD